MPDIEYPADLIDLQRASHEAWDAVEHHRKEADAARRAAPVTAENGTTSPRRWEPDEDREHDRLMVAATAAAEALRARLLEFETPAGATRYDVTQELHKAARG